MTVRPRTRSRRAAASCDVAPRAPRSRRAAARGAGRPGATSRRGRRGRPGRRAARSSSAALRSAGRATGRSARSAAPASPPTIRPNRNSSSSTSSSRPAALGGGQQRLDRERLDARRPGRASCDQRGPRRPRPRRRRWPRRPCRRKHRASQPGPVVGGPRRVGQRPRAADSRGRARQRPRTARRRRRPGRRRRNGQRCPASRAPRRATRGWRPAGRRCSCPRAPRRSPGADLGSTAAGVGPASSSARKRSTTPRCRASSSSDSPTIRPARSTASVPTSLRSWRSACGLVGLDLVVRRRDQATRLGCASLAHLRDDRGALLAGLLADAAPPRAGRRPAAARYCASVSCASACGLPRPA